MNGLPHPSFHVHENYEGSYLKHLGYKTDWSDFFYLTTFLVMALFLFLTVVPSSLTLSFPSQDMFLLPTFTFPTILDNLYVESLPGAKYCSVAYRIGESHSDWKVFLWVIADPTFLFNTKFYVFFVCLVSRFLCLFCILIFHMFGLVLLYWTMKNKCLCVNNQRWSYFQKKVANIQPLLFSELNIFNF